MRLVTLAYRWIPVLVLLGISTTMMAVPAYRGSIARVQPDGDTLWVRLHGDENLHWMTTEDGYMIMENKQGYLCYALVCAGNRCRVTKYVAHNPEKRDEKELKYLAKKYQKLQK